MSRIITDWNNARQDYPKNINLIELIEQQVNKNPQKPACFFADKALSFQDLNERANQLAHYIKIHIKGNGNYIVIHLDRAINNIIAILAILKSGNIYVPVDVNSNTSIVQKIISDCDAKAIISNSYLSAEILSKQLF